MVLAEKRRRQSRHELPHGNCPPRGNLATVNASANWTPVVSVDVGAQVSGQIERLYVELGQQVKKGDLIAEIDSTTQRNELEKSKAQLASYEAQLAARKTALDIAQTAMTGN